MNIKIKKFEDFSKNNNRNNIVKLSNNFKIVVSKSCTHV